MLVFGGCAAGGRFLDDLHALELSTARWSCWGSAHTVADEQTVWPKGRHFHGSVAAGGYMYVFFGKSNGYMNDVYRYHIDRRLWERVDCKDGPSRRYGHSVVEWSDDIYVYGGFDDFGLRCNDVWRYNWRTNEWTPLLHLQSEAPEALHHSAVVYQGSMLVWGGAEAGSELHEYRFGSHTWSRVLVRGQAPRARWGHRAFVFEDCMYVVGGSDAVLCHNTVWRFSLATLEWTLLGEAEGVAPRYFMSLVVVDGNRVIVFGGRNVHNYAFNDCHQWKQQRTVVVHSTYKNDFLHLLQSASADDPQCLSLTSTDGKKMWAHKALLFRRIPQLRADAANKGNVDLVCSCGALEALLYYVYTSHLPVVSNALVFELASLAQRLGLPLLRQRCEGALVNATTVTEATQTLARCAALRKDGVRLPRLAAHCIKLAVAAFADRKHELRALLPDELYEDIKKMAKSSKK